MKHDPVAELERQFGPEPGPLDEIEMWERYMSNLQSVNEQLDSDVAQDILHNLDKANSQYAHSFNHVRKDINKVGYRSFGNVLKMKLKSTCNLIIIEFMYIHECVLF